MIRALLPFLVSADRAFPCVDDEACELADAAEIDV